MNEFQNLKQNNTQKLQTRKRNNMSETLRPLRDNVIVINFERGESKSASGIILTDDDGKERGIRARWAQVYAVGPEQKDVEVGDWILMGHGRWTTGQDLTLKGQEPFRIWRADAEGILGVSTNGKPDGIEVETILDSEDTTTAQ
jgi:co-chaperonin GroES (HSP10)